MEDSRGEHWRDVSEEGELKNKIHALRWECSIPGSLYTARVAP